MKKLIAILSILISYQTITFSQNEECIEFGLLDFKGCCMVPGGSGFCKYSYEPNSSDVGEFFARMLCPNITPVCQICAPFLGTNPAPDDYVYEIVCSIPAGKYFQIEGECCDLFNANGQTFCDGVVLQDEITYIEAQTLCNDFRDIRFIICEPGVRHYNVSNSGQQKFLSDVPFSSTSDEKKFKVAVDGSESSKFIVSEPTFSLQLQLNNSVNEHGVLEEGDSEGEYLFTHPTVINDNNEELILELLDDNNNVIKEISIELYQPPVLFVHGLWSNSQAFSSMQNYLLNNYSYERFQLQIADYQGTNDEQFDLNLSVVPTELNGLFRGMHQEDIAVSKADVVGHSMGGLLTRLYQQSGSYREDINRIITLNTPHSGSQMGNLLQDPNFDGWRKDLVCDLLVPYVVTGNLGNCVDGAITDLAVGSTAIIDLNTNAGSNPIPSHSLSSTIDFTFPDVPFFSLAFYVAYGMTPNQFDAIFNNEENDVIVPLSSQRGGLSNGFNFIGAHMGITNSLSVQQYVGDLLEIDKTSGVFEPVFNPPTLTYQSPFQTPQNTELLDIQIANLNGGEEFEYNSDIEVEVVAESSIENLYVTYGNEATFDASQNISGSSASYNHNYRPESLGLNPITIYASGANKAGYVQEYVEISTNEVPIQITPSNIRMHLDVGEIARVIFQGEFDGFNVEVAADKKSIYNFTKGFILDSLGNGYVKANYPGTDTLRLNFNGVESIPLVLEVYGDFPTTTNVREDFKNDENPIKIYPNPTSSRIVVELSDNSLPINSVNSWINIYTPSGKIVKTFQIESSERIVEIDTSILPSGMYIVQLFNGVEVYSTKMIKL